MADGYASSTVPGRRLVPTAIDEHARLHPNDAFFSIPRNDNDLSEGFVDVTSKQFANAINRAAQWLKETIGADTVPSEVLGYQGPNDLRYPILAVAASKVGKQVLFPFSLAPPPIKLHLIHTTRCKYYLHTAQAAEQVQALLGDSPQIQTIVVPEITAWLNDEETSPFSYPKSWEDGKDDPWLIFHTSGTTGLPKPVTYTNRMMTSFDTGLLLPGPKEKTQLGWNIGRRVYGVAPLSHFSGLSAALQSHIFLEMVDILGPATKPPIPPVVADILRHGKADGFVGMPSILRDMARHPQSLDLLKSLTYVQWIGAALDTETGTALSEHVKICPAIGTTECGNYFLNTVDDPVDWQYYNFQSGQGIEFVERADDLYELVFKRSTDAIWQQVFLVFPDLQLYETKDLFRKHPKKEGLWSYAGRSDDMVVLSNSANINAPWVEDKIMHHPDVQLSLVGGSARPLSFAIIELTQVSSEESKKQGNQATLDNIWPAIEDANTHLSDYTKLRREFIILTGSEKPLLRGSKGSVLRWPNLTLFAKEIEKLYAQA